MDPDEGCEAREWLPADCGPLAGRKLACNWRYLLEAAELAGRDGWLILPRRDTDPVVAGTADGALAYLLMPMWMPEAASK